METFIGIAIGGTKTSITYAQYDGVLFSNIEKEVIKTTPTDDKKTIQDIFNVIDNSFSVSKLDGISIIVGSPIDNVKGLILKPPHLPGFNKTPIVKLFRDKYKTKVTLLNDADASALAEYKFGNHKDANNLVYFTFGTGFGSGLILNGKLYTGKNGMAGEIGHLRLDNKGPIGYGKKGSVEGYIAGGNIPKLVAKYSHKCPDSNLLKKYDTDKLTAKDVFFEARNNDELALKVIDLICKQLGRTCAIAIDLLNPDYVVIGGIYPRNLDLLETKTLKHAKKESISLNYKNCKIVPSNLKDNIDEYSSLVPLIRED